MPEGSATSQLYRLKSVTVLADGYGFGSFRKDVMAALTVAIAALPLSIAIAVASGVSPERGPFKQAKSHARSPTTRVGRSSVEEGFP